MHDGWTPTTLGEVATFQNGYPFKPSELTGRGRPVVRIKQLLDPTSETDFSDVEVDLRHQITDGDLIFSWSGTLASRIWNRGSALLNQHLFRVVERPGVERGWLHLALDYAVDDLMEKTHGTTMKHVTKKVLESHPVLLPPLPEQRRIVDVMGALDAQIEALATEAAAGAAMEGPLIEGLLIGGIEGVETLSLGEVGEFIRGRRFTKEEYVPAGLGCIHYGQVHTHFRPVAKQSLTFLPEESRSRLRLARPGDVVIAATSEDLDGLGKATVWLGDDDVAVHDDCYIFRHRLDPRFASYLFVSPWFQNQKRQYAGGTKVTRISGADLARIEIPIPPITVQAQIGEALNAVSGHVDAVRTELAAVRRLRASLLTVLLSQRIEIPESYDALLAEAV